VPVIDKDELKQMLGSEDLIVIDVRAGRDWSSSEFKIQGALREDPDDVEAWAGKYAKDKNIVLYCA
jgi:rhodanese-related sulfurtransferase